MSNPASILRVCGRLLAFLCLTALATRAAEPAKRTFDLPSGNATTTLKAFVEQSGQEIVYGNDVVKNTQTNAVKGELVPQQALEQMLSGTELVVAQSKGDLLAVKRAPDPKDQRAAQTMIPSDRTDKEGVIELTKITVTGSNIPTAADATASTVIVLGQAQIAATGLETNMLDLLRKQLPSIAGRSNVGTSNANNINQLTLGGSKIAIRNLDTLVLINGVRVATNGANGIKGTNFVDVNMIPAAAVDRVEVLTDGASAIYGSDAVGGVVNFILKSNYQGAEVGGRFAVASGSGNYTERSAHVTAGAAANGISITATVNWAKSDPLFQSDRPFSRDITGKSSVIAGSVGTSTAFLSPNLNSPRDTNPVGLAATAANLAALIANGTYLTATSASIGANNHTSPLTTLLLGSDQRSAIVDGTAQLIGHKLEAFGGLIVNNTKSFFQTPAFGTTLTEPAGAPYNPLKTSFAGVAFSYAPYNFETHENSHALWASGGLRGELGAKWNWETSYTYNLNKVTQNQANVIYKPNLARAVAGGFDASGNAVAGGAYSKVAPGFSESNALVLQPALDPFARTAEVDPKSLQNLFGTTAIKVSSLLASFDFKLVGTPIALPAGDLGIAVGGATRKETITGKPDANSYVTGPTAGLWLGANSFDPYDQSRRVNSVFAELRMPITSATWSLSGAHALDVILAYRIENYSDAGHSHVPKFGIRWQPVDDQLTVRFSYSDSFTAPALYFVSGPTSKVLTGTATLKAALGFSGQVNSKSAGNPDLKPATATTRSAGFVFSPRAIKGLTMSVDYISANQAGVAGGPGAGVILTNVDAVGAASPYINNVAFNNYPGEPGAVLITQPHQLTNYLAAGGAPGNIYLSSVFINLSGSRLRSADVNVAYECPGPADSKFSFSSTATLFMSYQFKASPTSVFYEYSGYATNGGTGQQGTLPKYRVYSVASWSRHHWKLTLANTYVPSVTDIGTGGDTFATSTTLVATKVRSFIAWDANASYTFDQESARNLWSIFRGMKFTVGVNNLANQMPPLAPQAFTDSNVDPAYYGVLGRLVYASATIKF